MIDRAAQVIQVGELGLCIRCTDRLRAGYALDGNRNLFLVGCIDVPRRDILDLAFIAEDHHADILSIEFVCRQ